jgi:hypothetical protein
MSLVLTELQVVSEHLLVSYCDCVSGHDQVVGGCSTYP